MTLAQRLGLADSKHEGLRYETSQQDYPNKHTPMTPGHHVTGTIPDLSPGDVIQIDPKAIGRSLLAIVIEIDNGGRSIGYAMPFSTSITWCHIYQCHKIGRAVFWTDGSRIKDADRA